MLPEPQNARVYLCREFVDFRKSINGLAAIVEGGSERKKVKNHSWAKLLARCFKVDVGTCPKCGEDMEVVAAVHDPASVRRYLRHIGLIEHPPPIAPARYLQAELAQGI